MPPRTAAILGAPSSTTCRRPVCGSANATLIVIRVVLPFHLRKLAQVDSELELDVPGPVTIGLVLSALETRYPVLRGTIRDHDTLKRRPFVRFFACKEDFSLEPPETPLPAAIVNGKEPFLIIGAIAGG